MIKPFDLNIDVFVAGQKRRISGVERSDFAKMYRLDQIIPNRYSEILVVDLMVSSELNGIDPTLVIEEIKRLESSSGGFTKEATQFKHAPLHPLWHQHYFSHHFVIPNIQNELKRDFRAIWDKSMGPEGSFIEAKHINALAHNITVGAIESRSDEKRLTGEWLIFSSEPAGNTYLCLATHDTGDQNIYNKMQFCCEHQFPALEPFASNRQV